jgi:hypothetical protein
MPGVSAALSAKMTVFVKFYHFRRFKPEMACIVLGAPKRTVLEFALA